MNRIASYLRRLLQLILLAGMIHVSYARAADVYVIAHPSAKLTADTIRDIYIGEKQFSGNVKIVPVDNSSVQADFLSKVLKLDQSSYANLWVKKSFRDALNPPSVRNSDRNIIDFVTRTPGAIAYVANPPPASVTLIQKY